jgi:hypothetical protein
VFDIFMPDSFKILSLTFIACYEINPTLKTSPHLPGLREDEEDETYYRPNVQAGVG